MAGLIADIGGTNVRFALVDDEGAISQIMPLRCAEFPTLVDACQAYLAGVALASRPRHAALAVASPILGDHVRMTNHPWEFSIAETRQVLELETLDVINDFIAVALGIPHLSGPDLLRVGGGDPDPHATIGVLGAGTGLGMSGLVRTAGGGRVPLSSEGGHVTLAAFDDRETEILAAVRRRFGHVSAERVLSGPGLVNLYNAVAEVRGLTADPAISPPECTDRGLQRTCPISTEALDLFFTMLGTVAADLALTLDARGGIYIGGGIIPRMTDAFIQSSFRTRFEDKGRFGTYLGAIPTFVIVRSLPAFAGLAALVSGT